MSYFCEKFYDTGDLSIQRQGEEVLIRLRVQDLDKAFLDKIGELLFGESALQKAGFSADEIRQVFMVSGRVTRRKKVKVKPLSDSETKSWTDDIERQWWENNSEEMLKGVTQ